MAFGRNPGRARLPSGLRLPCAGTTRLRSTLYGPASPSDAHAPHGAAKWSTYMVRRSSSPKPTEIAARANPVPDGAPAWVTLELLEQTIRVWQPYYSDPLTPETALAIIQSVGRLIEVLSEGSPP